MPHTARYGPLSHCAGYLAVRLGDKRFINPIAIYYNTELDEYRVEPPPSDILVYADIIKFALRAGYINCHIDGTKNVLPPDFWQWPESKDCILGGEWQHSRPL